MNEQTDLLNIETGEFTFELPAGFLVESLEDQAECIGPNDEFVVVSSYTIDETSSQEAIQEFESNVVAAMKEAASEPDLVVTGKLNKEMSPSGFPVWSLLCEAKNPSQFFDQYAAVRGNKSVLVTIEGGLSDRGSSALIEEAVYALEFK